jgi:hypothetical protein
MDAKSLSSSAWKAFAAKNKIKDTGLQQALATLEKTGEKDHEALGKACDEVASQAADLKKTKEAAGNPAVSMYLVKTIAAADGRKKQAAAGAAQAAKEDKASAKEEKPGKEEEDEEKGGDYGTQLMKGLKKVKAGNGKPLPVLICDARPLPAIMIAQQITGKHREALSKETGSKHFHKVGSCRYEHGAFVLDTGQSVPGLSKRIQLAVKDATGKKFKFIHGGETDETGEGDETDAGG